MHDVLLVLAAFLATCVEMVETLTIILAVGITKGWRTALTGMACAIVVLAVVVAILGKSLIELVPIDVLLVVVGLLLLIFGMQWLRKAILRAAGLKAEHDEEQIFKDELAELAAESPSGAGIDWTGFVVSFKSTFLEGLEIAFIVITIAASTGRMDLAATGAGLAIVFVSLVGVVVQKPLASVPENAIKHFVAIMLMAFGTFWGAEGVGVTWHLDAAGILALCLFYWVMSLVLIARLKSGREAVGEQTAVGAGA